MVRKQLDAAVRRPTKPLCARAFSGAARTRFRRAAVLLPQSLVTMRRSRYAEVVSTGLTMKQILFKIEDGESLEDALVAIKVEAELMRSSSILLHLYCGDIGKREAPGHESLVDHTVYRACAVLPEAQIVGLSCGGEIIRADVSEGAVLLSAFLFESSWVRVLSFVDAVSREGQIGEQLLQEIESHPDLKGIEILFAGAGIDSAPLYAKLKDAPDHLSFFGGYATECGLVSQSPFLVAKEGIIRASIAAVLYGGEELHINPGRTTGWKPLGRSFRVTKANGRRLYSVDGIPAYDLYDRFLKFPSEESVSSYAKEFPLMLLRGKMRLLRHPLETYPDSSILLDGTVSEGAEICLSFGSPVEIIRRMNARCEAIREFEPEAILLYSCQGRKNYWGDLVNWEIEPFQKVAETGGAFLDGQVMRNNQTGRVIEHRLTLLSVAMREGEKSGRVIPAIEVDDEVILNKVSLVHRMSTLIESMVGELQRTNDTLAGMNEQLARANAELHRVAITDELTGLYNRREIERRVKEALEKAKADKGELALVMLDIDFFKKVNDTYGHDVGDLVLQEVSGILRENVVLDRGGAIGRWGGEEFFVLLPDQGLKEALNLAERVRVAVEHHDFPSAKHLTVSVGVACADADSSYQAIFIQADHALYWAKQHGRNQVAQA